MTHIDEFLSACICSPRFMKIFNLLSIDVRSRVSIHQVNEIVKAVDTTRDDAELRKAFEAGWLRGREWGEQLCGGDPDRDFDEWKANKG